MSDITKMLESVAEISPKYSALREKPMNIFQLLNLDEFSVCRVMHDILSPSGSHGMENLFLKLFLRDVLKINDELKNLEVHQEFYTRTGRRIDLVITAENYFIPIEVKIFAQDLPGQCRDYYDEAIQYQQDAKLFYLSRLGTMPDKISTDGMNTDKIICVSFQKDIRAWLEKCLNSPEVMKNNRVREILSQFLEFIKDFSTKSSQEKIIDAIKSEIKRVPVQEKISRYKEIIYEYVSGVNVVIGFGNSDNICVSYYNEDGEDHKNFVARVKEARKKFKGRSNGDTWLYYESCSFALYNLCDEEELKKFACSCAEKINDFLNFPSE